MVFAVGYTVVVLHVHSVHMYSAVFILFHPFLPVHLFNSLTMQSISLASCLYSEIKSAEIVLHKIGCIGLDDDILTQKMKQLSRSFRLFFSQNGLTGFLITCMP